MKSKKLVTATKVTNSDPYIEAENDPRITPKRTKKVALEPLEDNVIVQKIEISRTISQGGIFIPESASKEKPQQATVIAVGPGRYLQNGQLVKSVLKPGDTIIMGRFGGTDVTVEGDLLTIIKEQDIVAKVV